MSILNTTTAIVMLSCMAFLTTRQSSAVDYTWNVLGGGTQAWNSAANWNPNTGIPNASADTVNFGAALAGDLSVDLDAVTTSGSTIIGSGTFGGTAGAVTTDVTGTSYFILGQSAQPANVSILSGGVAGSVNRISAPVLIGKNTDITNASTRDFTIASPTIGQSGVSATLANLMTTGQTLTIGSGSSSLIQLFEALVPGNARTLTINNFNNSSGTASQTTVINASWGGAGQMTFGSSQNPAAVYQLQVSQTSPATVNVNRQAYLLAANDALGLGTAILNNSNSQNFGGELRSNDDARTLAGAVRLANAFVVGGTSSFTVTGTFLQSNNRVLGNNLPSGKSLTLAGVTAPSNTLGDSRTLTIDGPGRTIITGTLINTITGGAGESNNGIQKRGTGRLDVTNAGNTISGTFVSNGGLISFGTTGAWGTNSQTGATAPIIANASGGVQYAPGVADTAGFAAFATSVSSTSTGFLALPQADAAAAIDFSTLTGLAGLSVVGDGDMTFTGSVTPGAAGYRWGGLTGSLAVGANAGTGVNAVTYTNGGTVTVSGSPDYTGATTISGVVMQTAQSRIAAWGSSTSLVATSFPTTLTVDSLGDAGSASSLGSSSNAATNLVIDRATLKVTGASASSTDRLFTVGPNGATIEIAGVGDVTLGSGGGANVGPSSAAVLTLTGTGDGTMTSVLADGVGALSVVKAGAGAWVLGGVNTYTGSTSVQAGSLVVNGVLGNGPLSVGSGALLSGTGTIGGNLVFGAGSTLGFDAFAPLTVSGSVTFASPSTFGVEDIVGVSSSTPDGTYTLIAGNVDTTNLANLGAVNAFDLGSGKAAYFQSGSLQLVVVPEPTSLAAVAAGAGIVAMVLRRRARS